jgi:hypothetical protein
VASGLPPLPGVGLVAADERYEIDADSKGAAMKATRILWIAAAGLLLAGCAHEPTVDIDAAKHALEEARQAQAADYAPQSWASAQDAEAKLDAELDAQTQHWSALRSYTNARQLALDAKAAAERSRDEASVGKDKAKAEASTMIAQANEEVSRAHSAVAAAPRGKGTEADLASLKSDATGIDDTLKDMQNAFDAGRYLDAKTKAQAAIDAAKTIEKEVETAKSTRGKA